MYYCSNQRWFCIRASAVQLEKARIISHILGLVGKASRRGVPYSFVREVCHYQDDSRARPIPRNMEILSLPNGPNKNESAYVSCSLPSTNPWYRASKTTSDDHACPHIQDDELGSSYRLPMSGPNMDFPGVVPTWTPHSLLT